MEQFAILHQLKTGQFLVDTTFNHDTEEYEMTIKFWVNKVNGYATMIHKWTQEKEIDFNNAFEKLKDESYCETWVNSFNA